MYNQGNHGHRPRMPMLPAYLQRPQALPPNHFPQSTAALPPPPPFVQQVSSLGQSSNGVQPSQMVHQETSFQVPTSMGQKAGRSYAAPSSQAHGSGGLYQNAPQHSQHPLHFGLQGHVRVPPHIYPPQREMPKASTQGHHQLPPPPGGAQNIKHAPPMPLASSGFLPPPPPPLQFSTLQNTGQLYVSESRPGGEDMNLDGGSNRAFPPLQFSSLPSTAQSSGSETRPCGEDMNLDGGNSRAFAAGERLLSTSCANVGLPSPPPKPMEEIAIQKIEALCKLIAQDGPEVEDKARQNKSKNSDFGFLFRGDPGTEAAVVHDYFLWMKKKCILEHRLNERKNNTLSNYQSVESSEQHDNAKGSSGADSDMEMEDDFTLSEKDQMLDDSVHNLGDGHPKLNDKLNTSEQLFGGLNSAEEVSSKGIRSGNESFPESAGLGRKDEGAKIISSGHDMMPTRSPSKFERAIVGSAETVMASELERRVPIILADNISHFGSSGCTNVTKTCHGELTTESNLIRLSESYASEENSDNDESSEKNINISTVSPLLARDSEAACYSEDVDSKSLFTSGKGSGLTSHIDQNAYEMPPDCVKEVKIENQDSGNGTTLSEALGKKDGFSSADSEAEQQNGKAGRETDENMSKLETTVKVDEFGRLVREGRIDSDSDDDKQYPRKRKPRKREYSRSRSRSRSLSRSRSRSRSPVDRRRRRRWRSPFRRKEKRSRSRSLSPWNRRKRSSSPQSRRSRDFGGDYIKWKNQDCFDFLRGRCHRGASCRYLHHETDKSAGSRRLRERHDFEAPSSSKDSRVPEVPIDISAAGLVSSHDEHSREGMHHGRHTPSNGQEIGFSRNHSLDNAMQYSVTDHTRQSGHVTALEFRSSSEKPEEHNHFHDNENLLKADEFPCVAIGNLEDSNRQAQMKDNSTLSVLSPDGRSMTAPSKISASESLPNMSSSSQPQRMTRFDSQSLEPPMHSQPPNMPPSTTKDMLVYPQHLPPAPSFPVQGGGNAAHMHPVSSDYGPIPQAAPFPYQSSRRESFQPCQASLPNQYHQFPVPSNNSWTSFLPLSTRLPYGQNLDPRLASSHSSSQYYQSSLQPRDDHFPQAPTQCLSKPLPQMEASTQKSIPLDNASNQPILLQESHSASSLSFVTAQPQPKHFSREPALDNLQQSSTNVLPKEAVLRSCSPTHPYSWPKPAQENVKYFSAEGTLHLLGEAASGYPPDPLDQSQPAHMLNIEGSRISSHHNPYTPVFEQSLGSKSSSNLFRPNMDNQNANNCSTLSSLDHNLVNDEGGCGVRSRPVTSPKSAKFVAHSLLRSGSDQYDPLFDSIEPSNSIRKDDTSQNEEIIGDSDIIVKPRSTYKTLDAEENKHEETGSGAVASTSSLNNGEYGETADAEVGDIESESLSTHVDVANTTTGEVEIDQDKSSKRKTKDSRSMKLFKVAVANFVKEVLKPSWRQGNMSKVAFKTIVKKTVDKVSGSMKGHRLPKSQAKIDQYIGSSQRKLTKLVMGYVDKYVKV